MMKRFAYILFLLVFASHMDAQEIRKIKITDLEQTIAEAKGPLVINFWATFCKPCIEEMPHFIEAAKQYKSDSLQLILVSLDLEESYPAKIKAVAKQRKLTAPIAWLDEYDADYFCPKVDPKWSGAIPATLFINNKKGYRKFYEEQLSREKLQKEIMAIL